MLDFSQRTSGSVPMVSYRHMHAVDANKNRYRSPLASSPSAAWQQGTSAPLPAHARSCRERVGINDIRHVVAPARKKRP
jgi:hypothetical protein